MALTFTHLEETASLLKSLSVLAIFKVGGKPLPQKVARMECCLLAQHLAWSSRGAWQCPFLLPAVFSEVCLKGELIRHDKAKLSQPNHCR